MTVSYALTAYAKETEDFTNALIKFGRKHRDKIKAK